MGDQRLHGGGRPLDHVSRRLWRARGRLSRKKAAPALGVSEATLQRIENGRTDPTIGQLQTAAELYGVSFHWLLFGEGAADPDLSHLGPDVQALLRQFMRDRFGVARADLLTPEQLREVNAQAQYLAGLVDRLAEAWDEGDVGGESPPPRKAGG